MSAYHNVESIKTMIRFDLEIDLDEINDNKNRSVVVEELIGWAETQGRLEELVTKAHKRNQGNKELREFA